VTRTPRPGVIWVAVLFCLSLVPPVLAQSPDALQTKKGLPPKPRCPLIEDPAGNSPGNPADFTRLFIDNDATDVYFRVDFAEPPTGTYIAGLYVNTDFDQVTGCNSGISRLNGSEYYVGFASPDLYEPFVGDVRDCLSGSDDFPDRGGAQGVFKGARVTVSVPIETLQILGPSDGFFVWFDGGGNFGPAVYKYQY
jgi:hypothetical protein